MNAAMLALLREAAAPGGVGPHEFSRPGGWRERALAAIAAAEAAAPSLLTIGITLEGGLVQGVWSEQDAALRHVALVGLAHIVAIIPNLDLNGLWTHTLVHLAGGLTLRSDMRPETLRSLISTARGA